MIRLGHCDDALLAALRREGLDSVEGAFAYAGGEELAKPGLGRRRRTRLQITDDTGVSHELFLKRYGAEPLVSRVRRLWTYGRRRTPGEVEFANVQAAVTAGLPTMRAVAAAAEPAGLLRGGRSYVIVTAVGGDALERCFAEFMARHEDDGCVEQVSERLGELVRALHAAGFCHRDLYSSHVFLEEGDGGIALHLIDLARMFRPRWRRFRWRVKDLAQLKYSMPRRWARRQWGRFASAYFAAGDKRIVQRYNRAIDAKVSSMRRRKVRRRRRAARRQERA